MSKLTEALTLTAGLLVRLAEHVDANERTVERLFAENGKLQNDIIVGGLNRTKDLVGELAKQCHTVRQLEANLTRVEEKLDRSEFRRKGAQKACEVWKRVNKELREQIKELKS